MIADLVAHGQHQDRRHQLLAFERELVRRVIGQCMAALLGFEQQRKGGIAADVDARDGSIWTATFISWAGPRSL